jgi:hypothetical protein
MKRSCFLFVLAFFLGLTACQKESFTKGIITVYDKDGNITPGAVVMLSQEDLGPGVSQTNVVSVHTSDAHGQTEHVLEMEAMMNVDAVLYADTDTLLYGHTVIRLVEGKTINKNVEITVY